MFINKTVFKKLLKEAYNSNCLKIGNVYGGIVIYAGCWAIQCREGRMPNWFKAIVIELIGEFPDEGIVMKYGKGGLPQQTFAENEEYDLRALYRAAKTPYTVTPMVFDHGCAALRFMQNNETKEIVALSEGLYRMIDFSNTETDESCPVGPSCDQHGHGFFWMNENCVLELCGIKICDAKTIEIAERLGEINFKE